MMLTLILKIYTKYVFFILKTYTNYAFSFVLPDSLIREQLCICRHNDSYSPTSGNVVFTSFICFVKAPTIAANRSNAAIFTCPFGNLNHKLHDIFEKTCIRRIKKSLYILFYESMFSGYIVHIHTHLYIFVWFG